MEPTPKLESHLDSTGLSFTLWNIGAFGNGSGQGAKMALEDAKNEVDGAFTRQGLRGLAFENAFAGATSFLRRRYSKDLAGVDLAITGVPFDQAVTHRSGTRFGPRAIREASSLQPFDPPYGWPTSPLEDMAFRRFRDLADLPPGSSPNLM